MAASSTPRGYISQFVDSVSEDLCCKLCSLVARKLTITSCCGESYCNSCILFVQQDDKPCPNCGEEKFELYPQVKFQKKVLSLQAYCPLKEKGCGWCGRLEQLEAHLHPDEGDCEYTDVHCPLKCQQKISRKDLTDHTANQCVKRDYICPYCAFKATYEIVSTVHWPECSYYPLPCPNRCGVTCERPTMEDHIKICPLEVVECAFHHVGCVDKFRREEEEEHMREKSQTHLTMMAAASVKMKLEFQEKLSVLEQRFQERIEHERKEFEQELQKREEKFEEALQKNKEYFEMKLQEKEEQLTGDIETLEKSCGLHHKFIMHDFSDEKAKDKLSDWKSPAMYTHPGGYRFFIGIDANGYGDYRGKSVNVEVWPMVGEFDDLLKWPVKARFTIELINHHSDGVNMKKSVVLSWKKPSSWRRFSYAGRFTTNERGFFISHDKLYLNRYLTAGALLFNLVEILIIDDAL